MIAFGGLGGPQTRRSSQDGLTRSLGGWMLLSVSVIGLFLWGDRAEGQSKRRLYIEGWKAWFAEEEKEKLRRSLEIRGWLWQEGTPQAKSSLVWAAIQEQTLEIRSSLRRRRFVLPDHYRSPAVRLRSFLICLHLFLSDEEAPEAFRSLGRKKPSARRISTSRTHRPSTNRPPSNESRRVVPPPASRPAESGLVKPSTLRRAESRPVAGTRPRSMPTTRPSIPRQPLPPRGWWRSSQEGHLALVVGGAGSLSASSFGFGGVLGVQGGWHRLRLGLQTQAQIGLGSGLSEQVLWMTSLSLSLELGSRAFLFSPCLSLGLQSLWMRYQDQPLWRHRIGIGGGLTLGWRLARGLALLFQPVVIGFPQTYRLFWQGSPIFEASAVSVDLRLLLRIDFF